MTPGTEQITLDRVCAGMVIANDVTDAGELLLPRGTVLGDAQLRLLRGRVAQLTIVSQPQLGVAGVREAAVRARVERLFRKRGDSSLMNLLEHAVSEYRLEKER